MARPATVTASPSNEGDAARPGTFMGHPKGLFVLFFTEMWERFSFYSMRGILTLYIAGVVLAGQTDAQWLSRRVHRRYRFGPGFVVGLQGRLIRRFAASL